MSEADSSTPKPPDSEPTPPSGDNPFGAAGSFSVDPTAFGLDPSTMSEEEKLVVLETMYRIQANRVKAAGKAAMDGTTEVDSVEEAGIDPEKFAQEQYGKLKEAWGKYEIEIPALEELEARLKNAPKIMADIVEADHRMEGRMGILLVPPSDIVGWPISHELRTKQGLRGATSGMDIRGKRRFQLRKSRQDDVVSSGISTPPKNNEWRVLVTDLRPKGRELPTKLTPRNLLDPKNKRYMFGDHDTRGMGQLEYSALSLQMDGEIDPAYSTWLLKGTPATAKDAVYAGTEMRTENTYIYAPSGQHVKYSKASLDYGWRGIGYRPTVEIPEPDTTEAPENPEPTDADTPPTTPPVTPEPETTPEPTASPDTSEEEDKKDEESPEPTPSDPSKPAESEDEETKKPTDYLPPIPMTPEKPEPTEDNDEPEAITTTVHLKSPRPSPELYTHGPRRASKQRILIR